MCGKQVCKNNAINEDVRSLDDDDLDRELHDSAGE